MRDQILDLVARHCVTLKVEAEGIAGALRSAGPDLARDRRGVLIATVHKLKGSSGSIGFAEISDLARRMESGLRATGDREMTSAEAMELQSLHDDLQDRISRITPEQSKLYARFA